MIRHLITTDLRRFRWLLAAWCALIGAYTTMMLIEPAWVGQDLQHQRLEFGLGLLATVVFITTIVLAALVVQGDATIGTDAFWLTRPIHPWQLLSAKAIVLMLALIVLPGVIEIAVMAGSHMPAAAIVRVAIASTASGLVWLAFCMATAVVTTKPRSAGADVDRHGRRSRARVDHHDDDCRGTPAS